MPSRSSFTRPVSLLVGQPKPIKNSEDRTGDDIGPLLVRVQFVGEALVPKVGADSDEGDPSQAQ